MTASCKLLESLFELDDDGAQATAELIGTFVVVLASCAGSMAAAQENRYGVEHSAAIAVGSGMAVTLMVWTLAPISAAHLNPAVTLGFAGAGLFSWQEVHIPVYLSICNRAVKCYLFKRY
ncbi:hypothetical protein L7F22_000533 [Adiantum nelumboides]|nr:hypothetical protein [Adiantum nelumboides]